MEEIFNIFLKKGVLNFFAKPRRPPSRCPRTDKVLYPGTPQGCVIYMTIVTFLNFQKYKKFHMLASISECQKSGPAYILITLKYQDL